MAGMQPPETGRPHEIGQRKNFDIPAEPDEVQSSPTKDVVYTGPSVHFTSKNMPAAVAKTAQRKDAKLMEAFATTHEKYIFADNKLTKNGKPVIIEQTEPPIHVPPQTSGTTRTAIEHDKPTKRKYIFDAQELAADPELATLAENMLAQSQENFIVDCNDVASLLLYIKHAGPIVLKLTINYAGNPNINTTAAKDQIEAAMAKQKDIHQPTSRL